jgi:hypothetical protein
VTHRVKALGVIDIIERTGAVGQQGGELGAECGLVGVLGDVASKDEATAWI